MTRNISSRSIVAASFALALTSGAVAQQCGKTGGTLTYVYHPEPTALSTIATSGAGRDHLDQDL